MRTPLGRVLADSHVAAVAIGVLLCWSLWNAFWALWEPISRAASFLLEAVAIFGIPYISRTLTMADRVSLISMGSYLFYSLVCLAAAELLSRWVFGIGPLPSLSKYRTRLARRNHV